MHLKISENYFQTMAHTLLIDSVRLAFGDRYVLNGAYLKLESSQIVGLLGLNGCGKTCLLRIMFGTLRAEFSSLRIDDTPLRANHIHSSVVNYIPQHHFIPDSIRVKDIFSDYGIGYEMFTSDFPGLGFTPGDRFGTLSGGERRLVEVYLGLKSRSLFCLMDEPFSQIMPLHTAKIKEILQQEAAENKRGFLITDHRYKDVCQLSDKLMLLKDGYIKEVGSPSELRVFGYIP